MRGLLTTLIVSFSLLPRAVAGPAHAAMGASSLTWNEWQGKTQAREVFRIAQVVDGTKDDASLVILDGGGADGMVRGALLEVFRMASPAGHGAGSFWVETGRVKVLDVQERQALAKIEQDGGPHSAAFFPRFPSLMAGDYAVMRRATIVRRQVSTPTNVLGYDEIFADPKRNPTSFELKAEGLEALRRAAAPFAGARLSLLMVEAYTDREGPAEANQVESYQRALTVRQFLIDELGFDERRIVAVGYGEAEQADESMAPGQRWKNRRIVFKAVTAGADRRP